MICSAISGAMTVEFTRGLEYLRLRREVAVPRAAKAELSFQLERWVDAALAETRRGPRRASHARGNEGRHPVNVQVGDAPIRASRRSARWCIETIERPREQRRNSIREPERAATMQAYDEAVEKFCRLAAEAPEGS